MGNTIMNQIEFMQNFLSRLVSFNKTCIEMDREATEKYNTLQEEQRRAMAQIIENRQHISTASGKKYEAFKRYEAKYRELDMQNEKRNTALYEKMTAAKLSGNTSVLESLRNELFSNQEQIKEQRDSLWSNYQSECEAIQRLFVEQQQQKERDISKAAKLQAKELDAFIMQVERNTAERIDSEIARLNADFIPDLIKKEYTKVLAHEPNLDNYICAKTNPDSIRFATLSCALSALTLSDRTISFLETHYPMLYKQDRIDIPFSAHFDSSFNYLFELSAGDKKGRETLIDRACSLALRLFMMIPPNKVNLTFIDPITLGETFALFTRLVDVDDRTTKVINGKIWTSTADIDERLRILTDHIANVTQRCLQGQYDNIQKYNDRAGHNAEPYEVLMIMDFPGGFTEESLRMLEQVISTGSKCGVYTVILKNGEQAEKIDEKIKPLIKNIESKTTRFDIIGEEICLNKDIFSFNNKPAKLIMERLLPSDSLEPVISELRKGFKDAEKIVISFEEMATLTKLIDKENWFSGDCSSELVIPIGIHGVENIQHLSFGVKYGAYHALIAGQIGSGKSSLLHTIIMSALLKYSADQLQIFLVDFKRGVEFKIYANHVFDVFRVVAIESEREFGCSVLEFLDKEQSRRADKFKRVDVDNVHDYRQETGEVLPRILLIIDEFHVLFSKDNDTLSKSAAARLEQIIRQGRAFGIHVILASQTMMNVGGIHQGVWGQIGIRIALKCPKADARFILGADNDAVDLLSPNDPGQAVYNSDCGNVIANTIFRVAYIEQKGENNRNQEKLLAQISEESQKLDRVKQLSLPETRVMLSNVEDNIYNPFQKFAQKQILAFKENAVLIGESLQLFNTLKTKFNEKRSSNMLVIGNDEQKARTMFTFCALSLTLHILTIKRKRPPKPEIYVLDYAPTDDPYEEDMLHELVKLLPDYIKYVTFEESETVLKELFNDLNCRQKNPSQESKYLLLFGLQRARELRSNDPYINKRQEDDFDDFGTDVLQKLSVTPYEMFMRLLQYGASCRIHSIIWEDSFKTFMTYYSNMLTNFDLRIGFTMPDDDSVLFMEEPNGSQISENNAIFSYNGNQRFRPYKKPDLDWLKKICGEINKF